MAIPDWRVDPELVAVCLCSLVALQWCFYHLFTRPPAIGSAGSDSFWGKADTDYDWCESNYQWSTYVAEPINAVTSLAYLVVLLLIGLQHDEQLTPWLWALLGVTAAGGLSSMFYHSSLSYLAQLLDELLLHSLSTIAAGVLLRRMPRKGFHNEPLPHSWLQGKPLEAIAAGSTPVLAVLLFCTKRKSWLHMVLRVFTTATSAVAAGIGFWLTAASAEEVNYASATERPKKGDEVVIQGVPENDRRAKTIGMVGTVHYDDSSDTPFQVIFEDHKKYWYQKEWIRKTHINREDAPYLFFRLATFFVVAILSSWFDIAACDQLGNLPFGLPYVQLRALGGHLCTGLGLYHFFLLKLLHKHIVCDKLRAKVDWGNGGILGLFPSLDLVTKIRRD